MVAFVLSVLIALVVSSLCSLMEAVLLSLTPSQLADISRRTPAVGAIWQKFKGNIDRPISVILILNTTAHTIGASVAGASFSELTGNQWLWAFSIVFTYLMLQYTEILPKTIGVRFNRILAVWMARPLAILVRVFSPVIDFIRFLNRPFEPKSRGPMKPATVEELTYMASLAKSLREIDPGQERIIVGAARLSKMTAAQVMIPIADVSMISASLSISEALVEAHLDAHTRFPVFYENDRNCIAGYVNFKEIVAYLRMNPKACDLAGVIRPVYFCSPDEKVPQLLQRFTQKHEHIALVQSESQEVLGLVTLEDIVEELVGELEDEFDRLPNRIQHSEGDHQWLVGGGTSIANLLRQMGEPPLEPPQSPLLSVAAWLEPQFERDYALRHPEELQSDGSLPPSFDLKPMNELVVNGLRFQIRRMRRHRIFEVAVFPQSRLEEVSPGAGAKSEQEQSEMLTRIYDAPGESTSERTDPENLPTSIDDSCY